VVAVEVAEAEAARVPVLQDKMAILPVVPVAEREEDVETVEETATSRTSPEIRATTTTAWLISNRTTSSPPDKTTAAIKLINGILNKLTFETFAKLSKDMEAQCSDEEILQNAISMIYDKALSEPKFAVIYASLCQTLQNKFSDKSVRNVLLGKCQEEFQKEGTLDESLLVGLSPEEREFKIDAYRRTKFGNIKFIVELFKKNIVFGTTMVRACNSLLAIDQDGDEDDDDNEDEDGQPKTKKNPPEIDIECACALLLESGKGIAGGLDRERASRRNSTRSLKPSSLSVRTSPLSPESASRSWISWS